MCTGRLVRAAAASAHWPATQTGWAACAHALAIPSHGPIPNRLWSGEGVGEPWLRKCACLFYLHKNVALSKILTSVSTVDQNFNLCLFHKYWLGSISPGVAMTLPVSNFYSVSNVHNSNKIGSMKMYSHLIHLHISRLQQLVQQTYAMMRHCQLCGTLKGRLISLPVKRTGRLESNLRRINY